MDLSNSIVAKSIIASSSNPYRFKDARKFRDVTKFIGHGSPGSSTDLYAKALKSIANLGEYTSDDIVGVSVNGNRRGRVHFNTKELQLAVQARATIITDAGWDRTRPFNIGEREVAEFLIAMGYKEDGNSSTHFNGVWFPAEHKSAHDSRGWQPK